MLNIMNQTKRVPIRGFEGVYEMDAQKNIYSIKPGISEGKKLTTYNIGVHKYYRLMKDGEVINFNIGRLILGDDYAEIAGISKGKQTRVKRVSNPNKKSGLPKNWFVKIAKTDLTKNINSEINDKLNKKYQAHTKYLVCINNNICAFNSLSQAKSKFESVKQNNRTELFIGELLALLRQQENTINLFKDLPRSFNVLFTNKEYNDANQILRNLFYYEPGTPKGKIYVSISTDKGVRRYPIESHLPQNTLCYTGSQFLDFCNKFLKTPVQQDIFLDHIDIQKEQINKPKEEIEEIKLAPVNFSPKKFEIVLTEDGEQVIYLETLTVMSSNNIVVCDIKYQNALQQNKPIINRLVNVVKPFKVYVSLQEIADWKGCTIDQLDLV